MSDPSVQFTDAQLAEFAAKVNGETVREQARIIRELEAVLREIIYEYDQTYDGEIELDGSWTHAASIPVEVMEKAKKLVA